MVKDADTQTVPVGLDDNTRLLVPPATENVYDLLEPGVKVFDALKEGVGVPDRDAVEEAVLEGECVLEGERVGDAVELKDLAPLPLPHHHPGLPLEEGQGVKEGVIDRDWLLHPLAVWDMLVLAVGQGFTLPEGVPELVSERVKEADKLPPTSVPVIDPVIVGQGVGLPVPPCVGTTSMGLLLPDTVGAPWEGVEVWLVVPQALPPPPTTPGFPPILSGEGELQGEVDIVRVPLGQVEGEVVREGEAVSEEVTEGEVVVEGQWLSEPDSETEGLTLLVQVPPYTPTPGDPVTLPVKLLEIDGLAVPVLDMVRVGVRELETEVVGEAVLQTEMVELKEVLGVMEGERVVEGVALPLPEVEGEEDTDLDRVGKGESVPDTVGVALWEAAELTLTLPVPQEDTLGDTETEGDLLPKGLEAEGLGEGEAHWVGVRVAEPVACPKETEAPWEAEVVWVGEEDTEREGVRDPLADPEVAPVMVSVTLIVPLAHREGVKEGVGDPDTVPVCVSVPVGEGL